jgi:hypothetical protein
MTNTNETIKKQNYTFWELINEFHIEIPIIQRDYAQGRKGNKTENIRLEFVKVLRDALLPNANKLHLNFVYGKVSNDRFVPLDGQQRLTTLFLLHWYLAKMTGGDKTILTNFSYQTRPSSKDFCQALINEPLTLFEDKKLSEAIKDTSWFFNYWEKDPTVTAMLNMLDTIQLALKKDSKEDLAQYWNILTEEKQIHFEFLDLEKFNLTDELYVKMNARGKELSPFENFKAWLMEFVENPENKIIISEENKENKENKDWKDKLDTTWANLFWNNKGDGIFTIDQAYMNFFRNVFQILYVKGKGYDASKARELAKSVEKEGFIPNQFYEDLEILDSDNLNRIFKIIQVLVDNKNVIVEIDKVDSGKENAIDFFSDSSIFKSFVSAKVTYADKARFYALYQYLLLKNNTAEFTLLSWMRVCRNLIANSDINSIEKLVSAMKGIDALIDNDNLYTSLIGLEELTGFNENQVKEEARKARLINSGIIKESSFLKFENHSYFRGQVDFLLEMSGEDEGNFLEYGGVCEQLFKDDFDNSFEGEGFLLERALLTKDNYSLQNGSNRSLLEIKDWRSKVLPKYTQKLKIILDELVLNGSNLQEGLNNIIKTSIITDEFRGFIDTPELFLYMKRGNGNLNFRYGRYAMYLLTKERLSGKHAELQTLHFYFNHLKYSKENWLPFKVDYHEAIGDNDEPCIYFNWQKKEVLRIYHWRDGNDKIGAFHIRFYDANINSTVVNVEQLMSNYDFKPESTYQKIILSEHDDLKQFLEKFYNDFNNQINP